MKRKTDLIYSAFEMGEDFFDGEILAFFKSREMAEDFVKIQPPRKKGDGKIIVRFFDVITEPGGVAQAHQNFNGA